jgi:hypothetical protein
MDSDPSKESVRHKFRVLPQSELSEQHFDEWPVWSEHYDYDELEDIERWGLDPDEVLKTFRQNQSDDAPCVYTMLEANPFPPRMRIFIRAYLEAANGQSLKGYVMDEDPFCLSVFWNGQEFGFSAHPDLESMNREQEHKLLLSLGTPAATLFPMTYRTDYQDTNGEIIAGRFQWSSRNGWHA